MTDELSEPVVEHYATGEAPQPGHEPDLPLNGREPDETGLLAFHCWRCGVEDYAPRDLHAVYAARRMRLFCIVCTYPDDYKWRIEVLEDGSERRRLYPVPERDRLKRLGPGAAEREALSHAVYERSTLRDRREHIARWIAERQAEIGLIDSRAAELDAQIPLLEDQVRKIELDANKDVKRRAVELLMQAEKLGIDTSKLLDGLAAHGGNGVAS